MTLKQEMYENCLYQLYELSLLSAMTYDKICTCILSIQSSMGFTLSAIGNNIVIVIHTLSVVGNNIQIVIYTLSGNKCKYKNIIFLMCHQLPAADKVHCNLFGFFMVKKVLTGIALYIQLICPRVQNSSMCMNIKSYMQLFVLWSQISTANQIIDSKFLVNKRNFVLCIVRINCPA